MRFLISLGFVVLLLLTALSPAAARPFIVGGSNASWSDFPWQVALVTGRQHTGAQFCGGSLISDQWVLTAAHCLYDDQGRPDTTPFVVISGTTFWAFGGRESAVDSVYPHPGYVHATHENDIALIKLAQPIPSGEISRYAALPTDDVVPGNGTVTGWGDTTEGGSPSARLMKVTIPIRSQTECSAAYPGIFKDSMVCAGISVGGKDSCQGDSGGPLVWQNANTLVGVVSFGAGCARPGYYGVYTRVSHFLKWIAITRDPNRPIPLVLGQCHNFMLASGQLFSLDAAVPVFPAVSGVRFVDVNLGFLAVTDDGHIISTAPVNCPNATAMPNLTNVASVAEALTDPFCGIALLKDGGVVGWGRAHGPPSLRGVSQISANFLNSAAVTDEGKVVQWDWRDAVPHPTDAFTTLAPIRKLLGLSKNVALFRDDTAALIDWNTNRLETGVTTPALTNIVDVRLGGGYGLALKSDGSVVTWGSPHWGEMAPVGLKGVVAIATTFVSSDPNAVYPLSYQNYFLTAEGTIVVSKFKY